MQILADYHTHTKYSHGKGTIEENVLEAISKGIKTIGISDHGYKHLAYGIKLNDIYKMREEIDKLNEKQIFFIFITYFSKRCHYRYWDIIR